MTSRIDLKRAFLAALTAVAVAFALVLVAGGSPASADSPDSWEASSEANNANFWVSWGANTHGEDDWECTKDETGDEDGEAYVLEQAPPTGSFWRLLVVKTGSEVNDLHWNPELGQSFPHSKKPGWSHVILCSRPIPETEPEPGKIIVKKEVTEDSATDQSFVFTTDYSSDFSLKDGESNDSGDLVAGTYSVGETVPTGWILQSATCDDQSDPLSISLQEGETVTCTFVNHVPDEVSPTTIVSTTTTIPDVVSPTSIVSTTVEVSVETLPFTGFESGTAGLLALALVASGALALVGTRVFRGETDE